MRHPDVALSQERGTCSKHWMMDCLSWGTKPRIISDIIRLGTPDSLGFSEVGYYDCGHFNNVEVVYEHIWRRPESVTGTNGNYTYRFY